MNLSNPFPSYAQYGEDIILLALLHDVDNGFYVDIGANYPVIDSVTKIFYDNGWRGINIEPIPSLYRLLQVDRPEDVNLNIGIGDKKGEIDFFENETTPGHSSFKADNAEQSTGDSIKRYKVKIKTLESVLNSSKVKKINFLKIDVEGFEDAVIRSNDWVRYRPEVVCVESSIEKTEWQKILEKNKYKLFINDGLNEYYIASESWVITHGFADRVVKLSHQSLKYFQYDDRLNTRDQLENVTRLNQVHFDMMNKMQDQNGLSLKWVSLPTRIRRSLYGLTIDWLRYKFNAKKPKKD